MKLDFLIEFACKLGIFFLLFIFFFFGIAQIFLSERLSPLLVDRVTRRTTCAIFEGQWPRFSARGGGVADEAIVRYIRLQINWIGLSLDSILSDLFL